MQDKSNLEQPAEINPENNKQKRTDSKEIDKKEIIHSSPNNTTDSPKVSLKKKLFLNFGIS